MKCKSLIYKLISFGCSVKFTWIPSHIGINLNELADRLAKNGVNKDDIDEAVSMSMGKIKGMIRSKRQEWENENIRTI